MQVAGIILNGGRSSRMGQAKGALSLPDGRSMLEAAIACLAELQLTTYIVGGAAPTDSLLSRVAGHFPDDIPGEGPVGGLTTVARRAPAAAYLVLTCDQPLVSAALASLLMSGPPNSIHLFASECTTDFIPFPGYYPQQLLMRSGEQNPPPRSLRELVRQVPVHWVPLAPGDARLLRGANTPEELAELRRQYGVRDAAD